MQWLNPARAGLAVVPRRAVVLSRVPKDCPVWLCVVQPPQELAETRGAGPLPPSPPCPPLISGVLEWWSSTGKEGGWVLGSLVAKRTPYGQLTGVTGGPGQFPEFT